MKPTDLQRRLRRAEDMALRLQENIAFQRDTIARWSGAVTTQELQTCFCDGWRLRTQSILLNGIDC